MGDDAGATDCATMVDATVLGLSAAGIASAQGDRLPRALIDAMPVAVYTTDARGRILQYNRAAADLWGREPVVGELWCGAWRLQRPDGSSLPHDACPMAQAIRGRAAIRDAEAAVLRPDDVLIPVLANPTPLLDATGAMVGLINMLIDISARRAAEERARYRGAYAPHA